MHSARLCIVVCLSFLISLSWTGTGPIWAAEPPAQGATAAKAEGEPEAPEEDLEQMVAQKTKRGDELLSKGQHQEAIKEYQAAYDMDPQPIFFYKIGEAERAAGRHKEAIRAYDRFVKEDPKHPQRGDTERKIQDLYKKLRQQEEANQDQKRPVWKKPWFWAVIGGSVAVVGIGVGVGLAVGLRGNNTIE